MKYIKIPEDIVLGRDPEDNEVRQTFVTWLAGNPLNGKPFGKDGKALRISAKIERRFEGKGAGDIVPLEDEEHELLLESSENPEGGFITAPAKLFLPFMDAVADATDEEPAKAE